jgi:ubiquitin C-terminal hydrolase
VLLLLFQIVPLLSSCYLNTLFQCLYMTSSFRRAVYLFEPPSAAEAQQMLARTSHARSEAADVAAAQQAEASKGSAADDNEGVPHQPPVLPLKAAVHHLQCVFAHLDASLSTPYDPSHMVHALRMNPAEQQDVHEFLNLLVFNVLERDFASSTHPVCRALIPKLFTGQLVHVMHGKECGHDSERPSEFHDLSHVQIKGKKNLDECLDRYFAHGQIGERARVARSNCREQRKGDLLTFSCLRFFVCVCCRGHG